MKVKFHKIFLALFFTVVAPFGMQCLYAQDASYPLQESFDVEAERERERVIYSSGEGDPLLNSKAHVATARDSALFKPATTRAAKPEVSKNSSRPASQEDDSILSFNFLYYIFEKYKMQDMVD
jgi:hypothetical protein